MDRRVEQDLEERAGAIAQKWTETGGIVAAVNEGRSNKGTQWLVGLAREGFGDGSMAVGLHSGMVLAMTHPELAQALMKEMAGPINDSSSWIIDAHLADHPFEVACD